MAFALFVLALAMMGAGGYAVWSGSDIIQMERGWALVIAGSVVASGGAVLLGVSAAVGRLGRLRKELARHRPAPAAAVRIEPSFPIAPPPIPSQAAADSLLEGGPSVPPPLDPAIVQGAPEFLMRRRGSNPAPEAPIPPAFSEPPAFFEPPAFPVPPPEAEQPVEQRTAASNEPEENAPFALEDPVVPDVQVAPPETPPAQPPVPDEPPTIVGTYNSGGNRYVMYSDGSIVADTPRGEFKFDTLDELKKFIAEGGEKG